MRVHPLEPVPIYRSPEPSAVSIAELPTHVLDGVPTWVPTVGACPGWIQILLPCQPDGAVGWIELDERIVVVPLHSHIEVDTRLRTVALISDGKRQVWPAGVGKPCTPTPRGRTFVLGPLSLRDGLVDRAVVLAAHVRTHLLYTAGLGAVGVHTWPGDIFGLAGSDGSVLVPAEGLAELERTAPAGTPVLIH